MKVVGTLDVWFGVLLFLELRKLQDDFLISSYKYCFQIFMITDLYKSSAHRCSCTHTLAIVVAQSHQAVGLSLHRPQPALLGFRNVGQNQGFISIVSAQASFLLSFICTYQSTDCCKVTSQKPYFQSSDSLGLSIF